MAYAPAPAAPVMPAWSPAPIAPPAAHLAALPARRESRFKRWRHRNAPKYWWKILLIGLLTFVIADVRLGMDNNLTLVPLVLLLASAIVPVTFVVYLWERGAFASLPKSVLGLAFGSGALVGVLLACSAEDTFSDSIPILFIPVVGPIVIALVEEGAKALSVIWFLSDRRLRGELDGLVLGAAAGMGFATLETAGYGFGFFVTGLVLVLRQGASVHSAFGLIILMMTSVLLLRMALAVFGHGTWTAIVCAAIWRERGPATLRISGGVLLAFAISVTLHAVWDTPVASKDVPELLMYPLWLVLGVAGLWILRFFIREAIERAQLGDAAPAPAPLVKALATYLIHPRRPSVPALSPDAQPGRVVPILTPAGASAGTTIAPDGVGVNSAPQRPDAPWVALARGA